MKYAYFVRHAKSSWSDPYLSDHDRPLNGRGKRDAPFMARMMLLKEQRPDVMITSTALRAKRTARHFRKALGLKKKLVWEDPRLYHAAPQQIIDVVRELPDDHQIVYVFGHNPGMTDVANFFSHDIVDNVPTCGIFKISCDVDSWYEINRSNSTRSAFYYPKQFNLDR